MNNAARFFGLSRPWEGAVSQPHGSFMKKNILLLLAATLLLGSCTSYDSWNRTTTGMSLGAMFGSTVGGLIGGYRGSDAGMLIGGAIGGAVGAASAGAAESKRNNGYEEGDYATNHRSYSRSNSHHNNRNSRDYNDGAVEYGQFSEYDHAPASVASQLEVGNIVFADANGNRVLEPRERAYVTFEIYNRSNSTAYNVAPIVTCDEKRINISPTAIIGDILPGQSLRYKAAIVGKRNLRNRSVTFTIAFPDNSGNVVTMRSFNVRTED